MVKAHLADLERRLVHGDIVARKHIGHAAIIAGAGLLETDRIDELVHVERIGKGERPHLERDRLRRGPGRHHVMRVEREMVIVEMPRRAAAAGLLGQHVVVIEPHRRHAQQVRRDLRQPRREHIGAQERVVRPDHLEAEKPVLRPVIGIDAELGLEQADQLAAQPEHRAGREHLLELDEAVALEKRDLRVGQRIGRGQLRDDRVIARDLHIGHRRRREDLRVRAVILREADIPVPPGLIVRVPWLADIGGVVYCGV